MVDPLVTSIAARQAAAAAPKVGKKLFRQARLLGTFKVDWIAGEEDLTLTADEISDLEQFLQSTSVRPILSLVVSCMVLGQGRGDGEVQAAKEALRSEALLWSIDRPSKWLASWDDIWSSLLSLFTGELRGRDEVFEEFAEELASYASFVNSPITSNPHHGFAADFYDLFGDLRRLGRANNLAERISVALASNSLPAIISHPEVDADAVMDFQKLYVSRLLINQSSAVGEPAEEVTASGKGWRVVLLGNPGAGKSTFVRHLTWRLSQGAGGEPKQPALVMRCREYQTRGWDDDIITYLKRTITAQTGVSGDDEQFADALLLGRFVCVFDGLDEITDINLRFEFVSRLEAFVASYPMTSILVTSRVLGYPRTPLSSALFSHYRLREFDEGQVETYAKTWFGLQNAGHLTDAFMHDSRTVSDLRANPLLLSLLCILYRARGAIPRRRREIYGRCADLLFNTWDAHRQIEQPEELPAYGGKLMQEIARWVYASRSAQQGLEEDQIRKVIGQYLESVGLTTDQARLRSAEFLEFCATRAWLLGSFGTNDYGQRMFAFTHRTFYEYFTAESLSRRVKTLGELCDRIVEAHTADETSVLPELLLQAYEERVDGGARDAFKELCARRTDATILLRLMNGALLASHVRRMGLAEVSRQWREEPQRFSTNTFDALLTLDPAVIEQFGTEFVVDSPGNKSLVATAWSARLLATQSYGYSAEVKTWAEDLLFDADVDDRHNLVANARWIIRKEGSPVPPPTSLMAINCYGGTVPGAAWHCLLEACKVPPSASAQIAPLRQMLVHIEAGHRLSYRVTVDFGTELATNYTWLGPPIANLSEIEVSRSLRRTLDQSAFSLAAALAEVDHLPSWLGRALEDANVGIIEAADFRLQNLSKGRHAVDTLPSDLAIRAASLPPWAADWMLGNFQIVKNPWDEGARTP